MYRYLDIYSAYRRLPLEPLSGLQYPQFQILWSLVLIHKSTTKNESINHLFYRNSILYGKGC